MSRGLIRPVNYSLNTYCIARAKFFTDCTDKKTCGIIVFKNSLTLMQLYDFCAIRYCEIVNPATITNAGQRDNEYIMHAMAS